MLYKYYEDPFVRCLNDLVDRQEKYTVKDLAAAANVHRSLVHGWLTGKPAPLARHVSPLTTNLHDSIFLDCLAQGGPFRIVSRRILEVPGVRALLYRYFADQSRITNSPAFRKLVEGGRMTKQEADDLRHAIREEQFTLDQLMQLIDEQMGDQVKGEKK